MSYIPFKFNQKCQILIGKGSDRKPCRKRLGKTKLLINLCAKKKKKFFGMPSVTDSYFGERNTIKTNPF